MTDRINNVSKHFSKEAMDNLMIGTFPTPVFETFYTFTITEAKHAENILLNRKNDMRFWNTRRLFKVYDEDKRFEIANKIMKNNKNPNRAAVRKEAGRVLALKQGI